MTDIIGVIRLFFYILTHPLGTYRFVKEMLVLFRVLHLDEFGRVLPLFQIPDDNQDSLLKEIEKGTE
jgi:hypothetical protein